MIIEGWHELDSHNMKNENNSWDIIWTKYLHV